MKKIIIVLIALGSISTFAAPEATDRAIAIENAFRETTGLRALNDWGANTEMSTCYIQEAKDAGQYGSAEDASFHRSLSNTLKKYPETKTTVHDLFAIVTRPITIQVTDEHGVQFQTQRCLTLGELEAKLGRGTNQAVF